VVAGTATAVSGRVQRRQAEKFADRDANIYAQREDAYNAQQGNDQPPPQQEQAAPPPPAAPAPDMIQQLKDLAELKDQGILTEEEFSQQKAKILGS
jgi:hypothetical protein